MMIPAELAYAAADAVSERGHCKHALEDSKGRVCLLGALMLVTTGCASDHWAYVTNDDARHACAGVLRMTEDILRGRGYLDGPVRWNNEDWVTGEDVASLFKEAGSYLERAS